MKTILVVLLACFACTLSHAQIQLGLWTDKSTYTYGDTVAMTITAYNPSSDTVILDFPSSCQVSYTIDDFSFINHTVCATVFTSRTIPPHSTIQWNFLKYPANGSGWPPLVLGSHAITGQVLGYATSDTLIIFVTPTSSVANGGTETSGFLLGQNYPNPFNPTTTISFSIPGKSHVSLVIFDVLGKEIAVIADEELPAGMYKKEWIPGDAASGIYFCRLQAGRFSQTRKLVLLR